MISRIKKFLICSFVLLFSFPLYSQNVISENWYGGSYNDVGYEAVQMDDGGFLITGIYQQGTYNDIYLIRTDENGSELWTKTYGGSSWDNGQSLIATSDHNYLIGGRTFSTSSTSSGKAYLLKVDPSGNFIADAQFGSTRKDGCVSVVQTSDSGFVFTGQYYYSDYWVLKTDANLNQLWSRTYGAGFGFEIMETPDNNYLAIGTLNSTGSMYIAKLNAANGDTIWTRKFNAANNGFSICPSNNGGFLALGSTTTEGAGGYDIFLAEISSAGQALSTRTFGGSGTDYGYSICPTPDGGYIMAGSTNSFGAGGNDVYVLKLGANLDTLWTETYGGTNDDWANQIRCSEDSSYFITASTQSFGIAGDVYFLKIGNSSQSGGQNGEFVSVKNGDWTDPLTWSTDPAATAIPDSNSTVLIQHNVVARSTAYVQSECYDLTIAADGLLDNYSSAVVSGSLRIKNDLINNGTISPAYDFHMEIGGDFYNNGTVTKHYISQYQRLFIMGSIYNNGSFRFTHTSFCDAMWTPNTTAHSHFIKSLNDSTIYLGEASFIDSLGSLVVDSIAIVSGQLNLNKSKLVLPEASAHSNYIVFDGFTIYGGPVEANNNSIVTTTGWGYLGNYYGATPDLVISNANLMGNFVSGGTSLATSPDSKVIFRGETVFQGKLADWYNSNTWYSGDRGIFIEGTFISNGEIYDATGNYGLVINQSDSSNFVSNNKLENKAFYFSGQCNFATADSLAAVSFKAADSSTVVTVTSGDIIFKNTVTVDFNGGALNLISGSKFYTTYLWYNDLQNIFVNANHSQVKFACINNNVVISNPLLAGVYFGQNSTITGDVEVPADGYVFPENGYNPHVLIEGNISNYGTIANHSLSGLLYLEITGDISYDGVDWSNAETKLNGESDQLVIIPNDVPVTGKVVLDAMLDGSSYQWQKDGVDITNATSSTLEFVSGVSSANYGKYRCLVDSDTSRMIYFGNHLPDAFDITDVVITNLDSTTTRVSWTTSVPASGFLFYAENDPSNGYPGEIEDPAPLKTQHVVMMENIHFGSTYYFIIDQNDAGFLHNVRSQEYSFVAGTNVLGLPTEAMLPVAYSLSQNYPNPFNPQTTIRYTLPKRTYVVLSVFDMTGREIIRLVNQEQNQGEYKVTVDGSNMASGVYFYLIKAGSFSETHKMILLR